MRLRRYRDTLFAALIGVSLASVGRAQTPASPQPKRPCGDLKSALAVQEVFALNLAVNRFDALVLQQDWAKADFESWANNIRLGLAPIVMWYPWKGGLFIKGGAGLAMGRFTVSPDSAAAEPLPVRSGSSLTFGVGFDIPVFKWLSITANVGAYFTALGDFDVRGTLLDDAVGSMYNANFAFTLR